MYLCSIKVLNSLKKNLTDHKQVVYVEFDFIYYKNSMCIL